MFAFSLFRLSSSFQLYSNVYFCAWWKQRLTQKLRNLFDHLNDCSSKDTTTATCSSKAFYEKFIRSLILSSCLPCLASSYSFSLFMSIKHPSKCYKASGKKQEGSVNIRQSTKISFYICTYPSYIFHQNLTIMYHLGTDS